MSLTNRFFYLFSAVMLLSIMLLACGKPAAGQSEESFQYATFRDVPGVTEEEIRAIEALQKQVDSFVYGMIPSTEAFNINGTIGGFSAFACEWLTGLFGIPFEPALYEWGDLLAGLETREIDFSGDLMSSEERRSTYSMTGAIAQRTAKYFRIKGSPSLAEIAETRSPRFGFFEGSVLVDQIFALKEYDLAEPVFVRDYESGYELLKSGKADALLHENIAEAAFDIYGDVIAEGFFPVIYTPVVLATQNPALQPIISVVQKALHNGAPRHLSRLYSRGEREYLKRKLVTQLSEEEKEYMRKHPVVLFVAENDNYPISFFNTQEKKWQGITFDVLGELQALTGFVFELVNDQNTDWHFVLQMLEDGRASMITELIYSEERKGRFLWPDSAIITNDYSVLLSKAEFRDITINEILYAKVGLQKGTAHTELFNYWFPDHENTVEYENMNVAFDALDRGEVDMVMTSQHQFLTLTNFRERPGYKINVTFDRMFDSTFGFNKNETVLCSIIDKALLLVDTKGISGHWMRKTFDYRIKLMQARMPLLLGATVLGLGLLFLLILFQRKRYEGRKLEKLVQERTAELHNSQLNLETALEAAKAANHSKSVFLASMSHEIRTPLNAVLGLSEIKIHDETVPEEIKESFVRIFNSGSLLLGIVNDILDLSKIEAGKLELIKTEYDVASLINDTVFLNRVKYENKPIKFILNVEESVPSMLFGDELRTKQILNNLLSNAFKYTDYGEVEFSVAVENSARDFPEKSGGGGAGGSAHGAAPQTAGGTVTLVFRVRDTGHGMTPEQLARLGDEYSRFNLEANRVFEGTGLGMSIARNMIRVMNGEILVESEYGKGSLFTVRLPQGTTGALALGREAVEKLRQYRTNYEEQIKKAKIERVSVLPGKILLVDDMEMNLLVVKEMLMPYGLQIDMAASGFEAIEKVKNGAYDLVFMDHMMPKMDGIEATREIRKLGEKYEKLTIIALTADAILGMKEMFLENGFNDFISKPVSIRKLNEILNDWMSPEKRQKQQEEVER